MTDELISRALSWLQDVFSNGAHIGAVRKLDWATSSTLYALDARVSAVRRALSCVSSPNGNGWPRNRMCPSMKQPT